MGIDDYFAGFFDGEGCIRIRRDLRGPHYDAFIFVVNTDIRLPNMFRESFGGRVEPIKRYSDKHKTAYRWYIHDTVTTLVFLDRIGDKLIIKKPQAELVRSFVEMQSLYRAFRKGKHRHKAQIRHEEAYWTAMAMLNKTGPTQ